MSLEFIHGEAGIRPAGGEKVVVDRHLYLTEDKSRVVEEGDVAGRWLWASPGQEVPRAEAERLGAVKAEPVMAAPTKAKPAPANKARAKASGKGD